MYRTVVLESFLTKKHYCCDIQGMAEMNIDDDENEKPLTAASEDAEGSQQSIHDQHSDSGDADSNEEDGSGSDAEKNTTAIAKDSEENEARETTGTEDVGSSDASDLTAAKTTAIEERRVKLKVKRQMQKERERQRARRIRKAGESAAVTKVRRDNRQTVKDSYGWD